MPEFLDYMKETAFENELTLTKTMKTEINQSLDSLIGEQTVFWQLWDTSDERDDVAEVYGTLNEEHDMIAEIYSPPRIVKAARARGLKAELSVDVLTGNDLNQSEEKARVREELKKRRPRLLITSPPCKMFSIFQNLRKDYGEKWEHEMLEAISHVDYSMQLQEDQRQRGDLGLHEHPDTAKSWELPSVKEYLSHDEVVLVKADQCRFGLKIDGGSKLSRKSTLFATSSDHVAVNLQRLCQCPGPQPHDQLVNGKPLQAQEYPPLLVKAVIDGIIQEWVDEQHGQPDRLPELADLEQWIDECHPREPFRWRNFHGSAIFVAKKPSTYPARGPGHRDLRWTWVKNVWDGKWLRLEQAKSGRVPKFEVNYFGELNNVMAATTGVTTAEKAMVLRAHINLGHPTVKEFSRLLKAAGTREDIIQYVLREFQCEGCLKERRQPTRLPAATPRTYDFNVVIGVDLIFLYGENNRDELPVLNCTCFGTLYSTFTLVHPNRRGSQLVWAAFAQAWLRVFGAPSFIIMDQGLEFMGSFLDGVENHAIRPLWIDRDAPWQNGITERRGGLFKEVYYKTRELRHPTDIDEVKTLIHEVSWALQTMTNRSGYSPAQRVLGRQPSLNADGLTDTAEYEYSKTGDSAWAKAEEIRQAARRALMEVDSRERLQRAVRARPRQAREQHVFEEGEPVSVWRIGRRGFQAKVGPCFVVLQRGDTIWVTRRGELWRCNRAQVFPMGALEKQGLEVIPLELLRAKEKLRFQTEKLGYVDVEQEGPPQEQPDVVPIRDEPDQAPAEPEVLRRLPGTPMPRTPARSKAAPATPAPQTPGTPAPQTPAPTATAEASRPEPTRARSRTPPPQPAKQGQKMTEADELWKATLENQESKASSSTTASKDTAPLRMWTRYDMDAKRFRASNSKGPLWSDVIKRITIDLVTNKTILEEDIYPGMAVHQIHARLPTESKDIETVLIYRQVPDHPDPGVPFEPPTTSTATEEDRKKTPEEDARLVDKHLKRSLDDPTTNDRVANRSRVFGTWQADRLTEWGDKKNFPVMANVRDVKGIPYLENSDSYFNLKTMEDEFPLHYLTKQSGKELNEKKLTPEEIKLFNEAKKTEIGNLVGSNAIELVIDEGELQAIRDKYSHRIMPSRFLITKKMGEIGEQWKAKARWILLGHKDPDSLQLERFAPTPSSTTVMLTLQIIASHHYHLYIMDVSSAFGQSDHCEREQGPLWASMPPTGIPDVPKNALIRVKTAVYGLVNAPAVWRKTVRRHLLELGYSESALDPCLYHLPAIDDEREYGNQFYTAGIVLLDVDDFCQGGNARHESLMANLRTKLKFGKWKDVYQGSAEYIGRTLTQLADYEVQVSMKRYIQEKLKPVTLPKERMKQRDSPLDEKETTLLRGVGGSLLWVGKEGRPDVGACAMAMSWSSAGPTIERIHMANKTVNELKMTMEVYLRVLPIPANQAIWMSVADASMANVEQKSQGGFVLALAHESIMAGAQAAFSINSWRSHKLKRVVKATLGSEALAMDDALGEIEWIRALWHEVLDKESSLMDGTRLGDRESVLVVRAPDGEREEVAELMVKDQMTGAHVTDAKALFDLLSRRSGNAGQDRRAQIDVCVICVSAKALRVKTFWVPGSEMLADPLTKRCGNSALMRKVMKEAKYSLMKSTPASDTEAPPQECETKDS